ncbi:MAG TPA: transketolase [Deltaproteobacteria bacterium]|nr:transketolase [Deltaproteobacteria bacterium]HPR55558.1 transketolase [Deltaproteobacteria bacterium]HXK46027.1 transketolase [Deltaproteobacteria bacterium]
MELMTDLDRRSINTIRLLAADTIQKANSGHPGLPLGAAPMAYVLWTGHLRHNPSNPRWVNRDRFVLSAGHGSALLYAMLHLTGYDLSIGELQRFRQWGSKTPGHPEIDITPGVEITTGPLGQGISSAVGMAIAEAHMGALYNRPGHNVMDHYTYVLAGDGDLMEGVAYEACSLAGHLGLGKLIVLYDSNRISLAGSTELCFSEDVERRFEACGWHTQRVTDGNDASSIDIALVAAREEKTRPSLIIVETTIGFGSPGKQGSYKSHGSPLGEDELRLTKRNLGWEETRSFFVPDDVGRHFLTAKERGKEFESDWQQVFFRYSRSYPELAEEFRLRMSGELPKGWDKDLSELFHEKKPLSTRKALETVLQHLAPHVPALAGGSADLNPSTLTWIKACGDFQSPGVCGDGVQGSVGSCWSYEGRNIHFGVREHAMAAVTTGMALHGGIIPYASTFLTFSDYMKPAMRIACLCGVRSIYIFTHDSIGVGEDGPTHQPIEHLMGLRGLPNLTVIRPADAHETVHAMKAALARTEGPTALILTRQDLPLIDQKQCAQAKGLEQGGYVLWESSKSRPDVIIIATGSEVNTALEAAHALAHQKIKVRVVSLPSWELFDRQCLEYRESVLPPDVKARIAVEAGLRLGWEHYVGSDGVIIGMDGFGASAPASVLFEKFGITVSTVVTAAQALVKKKRR